MTVVHGVGVGGGSLTYACTLPTPADPFFVAPSWSGLADWKAELAPHYQTVLRMLGATMSANPGVNPSLTITALAERAMSFIAPKAQGPEREDRSHSEAQARS